MSDRITIAAEPRTVVRKQVKRLRREGWVPAVIYGQDTSMPIQLERLPLRRALRVAGTTNLINIDLAGNSHTVLAREIQQHLTRGDLIHVDFLEVDLKTKVTAEAQLRLVGQAAPFAEGLGVTTLALRSVEIECLPEDLVDEVEVDATLITSPDDVISVGDLAVPEGVTVLTDPKTVAARFERARIEEEEEEEEELFAPAADAVEVIGKGKEEEEEFEE